jgi:malate dehydrogenase
MIRRNKVTVVGAGNVGATAAHWIAAKELADVVLVDIVEGTPQGKSLDLAQAAPIDGFDVKLVGANSYEETKDSDVVIITAGLPRKPGMSRDDLLKTNADIVGKVTDEVAKYSPNAFIIVEELNVSVENVTAFVLGGHGDTMVPLPRYSTVAGIPITELIEKDKLDAIIKRTANGGAEIVGLLKTGSAYYAPSLGAVEMAEAILKDKKKILPCAVYLEGEYGVNNLFVGVPVKLGKNGVEQIIEFSLTNEVRAALQKSAGSVQELIDVLGI